MRSPQFAIKPLTSLFLPQVMAIDRACSKTAWPREEYVRCLSADCHARIALEQFFVLGFSVYTQADDRYTIDRLGICPLARRLGIGRALIRQLVGKLHPHGRRRIEMTVEEANLPLLMFLKACQFKAVAMTRAAAGDQILMRYDFRPRETIFEISEAPARRRARPKLAARIVPCLLPHEFF